MKKFFILSTILFAFFTVVNANEENTSKTTVSGTVTATRLNLRMAPSLQSPRAGIVKKDTKLNVVARHDNWLAVEIPSSVKVFVSEAYIHNNKTIRRIAMRSGMSASAPTYGDLPKGFEVKVMDERNYGWVRIEPPKHLRLYAAHVYIQCDKQLDNEEYTPQDILAPTEDKKATKAVTENKEAKENKAPVEKKANAKEQTSTINPALRDAVAIEEETSVTPVKAVEKKVAKTEAKKVEAKVAPVKAETKKAETKAAPVKAEVKKAETKAAPVKAEVKKAETKAASVKAEVKKVEKKAEAKATVVTEKKTTSETKVVAKAVVSWEDVDKAIAQLDAKRTGPVKVNGILVKVPKSINAATEYAILAGNVNLGFVSSADKALLSFYVDKQVAIEGDKYVVNNWKAPIVKVFSIKLAK